MANQQSVTKLLTQQLERLNQLYGLLVQEQKVLSERQLDQLADIPPQKTKLLIALQQGDQALNSHDLSDPAHQEQVAQAKSQLKLCKRLNEENGRMIALAMTSIGKIQGMMSKASQQTATTTYTAQGSTNSISSTGNLISV